MRVGNRGYAIVAIAIIVVALGFVTFSPTTTEPAVVTGQVVGGGLETQAGETFSINGTVKDINGNALNNTNITVVVKDNTWSQVAVNTTTSNATGWFNLTLDLDNAYFYQLKITHFNETTGHADWVGSSLPEFPYSEFSKLNNMTFYLKEAGTLNLTAINNTGPVTFGYQIKDQKLGYPIGNAFTMGNSVVAYLPKDRNYSVMIYPSQGSGVNFVPVTYNWNNFSWAGNVTNASNSSYSDTNYTYELSTISKRFNITQSFSNISGYLNGSQFGITSWDEMTIIPYLLEPSDMIFMNNGELPFNASAWNGSRTDNYTLSSGYYSIAVPYAPSETVNYLFMGLGRKDGTYYAAWNNQTITGTDHSVNFTMQGMLGVNGSRQQTRGDASQGVTRQNNMTLQNFSIVNATGYLSNLNAHIEAKVDYTSYYNGTKEFTFMTDLSGANSGNFTIPLLNVTGIKEMNIYSMSGSPKRQELALTDINTTDGTNVTLSSFNPADIDGNLADSDINILLYTSNSTCDVPTPPDGCLLVNASKSVFGIFKYVMGGGDISFRMGSGNISVHYANVDMLASGPPDAAFDNSVNQSNTSAGFDAILRFGSTGPTIYDYVIVSFPYTEVPGSGLNDSGLINMSIKLFYDDNWNVIWNTTANGTNATLLAGNYSHYSDKVTDWQTLMNNVSCITNQSNSSNLSASFPCFVNTTENKFWIRLPYFSGSGPDVDGDVPSDVTPPQLENNQTSSTAANGNSVFAVYVSDDAALSSYVFSIDNGASEFTNDSVVEATASQWVNVTKTLTSATGTNVGVIVYANDTSGNWNGTSWNITTTAAASSGSTSSSSGSGGGGGGSSSTNPLKQRVYSTVQKGDSIEVNVNKTRINVTNVTFSAGDAGRTVIVKVMQFTTNPTNVKAPSGKVYGWLQVNVSNLDDVEGAEINFKVEKAWLTENGYKKGDVVLQRYKNSAWSNLDTTLESEDDDHYYYSADTPGFSDFAITAVSDEKETGELAAGEPSDTLGETPEPGETPPTETPEPETPTPQIPPVDPLIIGALIVVVVIAAIAILVFKRK